MFKFQTRSANVCAVQLAFLMDLVAHDYVREQSGALPLLPQGMSTIHQRR